MRKFRRGDKVVLVFEAEEDIHGRSEAEEERMGKCQVTISVVVARSRHFRR